MQKTPASMPFFLQLWVSTKKSPHASTIIVCLILVISFILRLKGIWYGNPILFGIHPDEGKIANEALRMLHTFDPDPRTFIYPSLNYYLQAAAYGLLHLVTFLSGHQISEIPFINYYLAGRTVTVLYSVATIGVTYLVGAHLFNKSIGIIAALFVAISHLHLSNSYIITVDSPFAFWSLLSLFMACKIFTSGEKRRHYLLAGVFAGLAISCKYTAVFSIVPAVVAGIYQMRRTGRTHWISVNLIVCLVAVPLAFFITSPYAVIHFKDFWGWLAFQQGEYSKGHPGAESSGKFSLLLYIVFLWQQGYGVMPTILACIGLIVLSLKQGWKAVLVAGFPLLMLLFLGMHKTWFSRNLVPIIPTLALLSSVALFSIVSKTASILTDNKKNLKTTHVYIVIVLMVITMGYPAYYAVNELRKATLPDTRWIATQWVLEHLPEGSFVIRECYVPIELFSSSFQVLNWPGIGFALATEETRDRLSSFNKADYVIFSEDIYSRYLRIADNPNSHWYFIGKFYKNYFNSRTCIMKFIPDWKNTGGPTILIFDNHQPQENPGS